VGPERYESVVNYSFHLGGEVKEGFYHFKKPLFPNEAACRSSIEKFQEKAWQIYYNPYNPQIASLQKLFPFKALIHTILSFAVLLYFLYFRSYLFAQLPDSSD
jgi:hypothetical protein